MPLKPAYGDGAADSAEIDAAGAVLEADYNANSILAATADNTPVVLTVPTQTFVGRITAGNIAALTPAQGRTLFDVPSNATVTADITSATAAHVAALHTNYDTFRKKAEWNPSSTVTVPGINGFHTMISVGTVTVRTPAATNMAMRATRLGFVSAAGAGSLCGPRVAVVGLSLGNATNPPLGGFWWECVFSVSDAVLVAGARMFLGVSATTASFTNVEPSTLTNCIGIGHGAADSNLKIFYGGSAAQTPIDLFESFPADATNTYIYSLILYANPAVANTVEYLVTRLDDGTIASGTLTGAAAVLPQSGTMMTIFNSYRTNNATAAAVGLDIGYIRVGRNV